MFTRNAFRNTVATLAVTVALSTSAAFAQGPAKKDGAKKPAGIVTSMKRLDEVVTLTPAQKDQLKPIFAQAKKDRDALKADTTSSPKDKRAKSRELAKTTREKVEAILTAEQKTKLKDAMDKAAKEKAKDGEKKPAEGETPKP